MALGGAVRPSRVPTISICEFILLYLPGQGKVCLVVTVEAQSLPMLFPLVRRQLDRSMSEIKLSAKRQIV